MKLTNYEKKMLNGDFGEAKKIALEVLVKLGEAFNADELIEIEGAHVQGMYMCLHDAGLEWLEKLASLGGKVEVPSTLNPSSICFQSSCGVDFPDDWVKKQNRFKDALVSLGVQPTWTCTPYYTGNIPRLHQPIATAESSVVSYMNSVIGARTERMGVGLEICAALTGRNIKGGLYLEENRKGTAIVNVNVDLNDMLDFYSLGYIIGEELSGQVPVIKGLENRKVSTDHLKSLGAAAATSGSIALYHVEGITPEAKTMNLFDEEPKIEINVNRDNLNNVKDRLTTGNKNNSPDIIALGCPHYSTQQLFDLAELLENRKVKDDIEFWVYTSLEAQKMAEDSGKLDILKKAGVKVLPQNCLNISPCHDYDFELIMTDSAKFGFYLPSEYPGSKMIYGTTKECVDKGTIKL